VKGGLVEGNRLSCWPYCSQSQFQRYVRMGNSKRVVRPLHGNRSRTLCRSPYPLPELLYPDDVVSCPAVTVCSQMLAERSSRGTETKESPNSGSAHVAKNLLRHLDREAPEAGREIDIRSGCDCHGESRFLQGERRPRKVPIQVRLMSQRTCLFGPAG
jgi:hypothetical protein